MGTITDKPENSFIRILKYFLYIDNQYFPVNGCFKTYFLSDLIKPNNFYYKKTYFLRKKKS